MRRMPHRFAPLGIWLTIAIVGAGNGLPMVHHLQKQADEPVLSAEQPLPESGALSRLLLPTPRGTSSGRQIGERGDAPNVLAACYSTWQLMLGRLAAASASVLKKPQPDRHLLLAMERSAAASRAACIPLLRSTHLRI